MQEVVRRAGGFASDESRDTGCGTGRGRVPFTAKQESELQRIVALYRENRAVVSCGIDKGCGVACGRGSTIMGFAIQGAAAGAG